MKKQAKYSKCALLVLLVALIPACDWFDKNRAPVRADKPAVEQPTLRLISVNDPVTHQDASLPGSVNIAFDKIDNLDKETQGWNKHTTIVVYCTNYECSASKTFVKKLKELGFTDVRAYSGGTAQWYQLGQHDPSYKLVGPQTQEYLKKEIRPVESSSDIPVITAAELHQRMEEAGLK